MRISDWSSDVCSSDLLSRQDMGASWRIERGAPVARMTVERIAADQTPGEISIGYYDCARDYQTGLQRAHFGVGRRSERIELPAALMPGEAKALAERKMAEVSVRPEIGRASCREGVWQYV